MLGSHYAVRAIGGNALCLPRLPVSVTRLASPHTYLHPHVHE